MFNSPLLRVLAAVVLLLPFTWATAEHVDQREMLGKARALAPGSGVGVARRMFERRAHFFGTTDALRSWLARRRPEHETAPLPAPAEWVAVTSSDLLVLLRYDAGRLAGRSEVWRRGGRRDLEFPETATQARPSGPAGS